MLVVYSNNNNDDNVTMICLWCVCKEDKLIHHLLNWVFIVWLSRNKVVIKEVV